MSGGDDEPPPQTTTTTVTKDPAFDFFKPFLGDIGQRATTAAQQAPSPFQGPFLAGAQPAEQQAAGNRANVGQTLTQSPAFQQALDLGLNTLGGQFVPKTLSDLTAIPGLTEALDLVTQNTERAFSAEALPSLRNSAFLDGSRSFNTGLFPEEQELARRFSNALAQQRGSLVLPILQAERERQFQAPQFIQQAAQLGQLGPTLQGAGGAAQRSLEQIGLDQQQSLFSQGAANQFLVPNLFSSIIQPAGSTAGTIEQTTIGPGEAASSPFSGALTGALGGGLGTAAALAPLAAAGGPISLPLLLGLAGGGALLGGGAGFLGS